MINGMINGTISDLESEILEILRKNEDITVPEMAALCKKSSRTISRAIAALKSKKLIERVGSNKAGSWKVK
ncbi:MAG: MarR family transcriptional regulator, partial [Clostridiales bacterium]|nr:MarR family transcriptional regulator [Clostridiales bacterium]